jgi:hypothetical protein
MFSGYEAMSKPDFLTRRDEGAKGTKKRKEFELQWSFVSGGVRDLDWESKPRRLI